MSSLGPDSFTDSLLNLWKAVVEHSAPVLPPTDPVSAEPVPQYKKLSRAEFLARLGALTSIAGSLYLGPELFRAASASVAENEKDDGTPARLHTLFTAFEEKNPLALWTNWSGTNLKLQPYGRRMSAVPVGPSVLARSADMAIRTASFDFALGQPADFILRGADKNNCYRMKVESVLERREPVLRLIVTTWLKGRPKAQEPVFFRDPMLTRFSEQRLRVEMDGKNFVAYLEQPSVSWLFGWARIQPEPALLHYWSDELFSEGHVGLWGPETPAPVRKENDNFRVFSVGLDA